MEPADPFVSASITDFTQRIEALRQYHQQLAVALCQERMAQDTMLFAAEPVRPQRRLVRLGRSLSRRIVARLARRSTPGSQVNLSVVVIDQRAEADDPSGVEGGRE
jgi:hypothetical protein